MKLDFSADGRAVPILEVGDLVRLTRVEAGPTPTAQAREWGRIRHITDRGGLEIVLTGYFRPRGVALAVVRDFPATNVIPLRPSRLGVGFAELVQLARGKGHRVQLSQK